MATETANRDAALRVLRGLVATHLEGSDDAVRATELLDALDSRESAPKLGPPKPVATPSVAPALTIQLEAALQEDRERRLFGCTAAEIDEVFAGRSPRYVALYAMGTLSNAQEYIHRSMFEDTVEWSVADRDANTLRLLINVAKYAIDKAVPQ